METANASKEAVSLTDSIPQGLYVQYGCGLCAPPDWLNFDASPTLRLQKIPLLGRLVTQVGPRFPANVRCGDIIKGLPVAERSCRAIYCSHVLEHLSLADFPIALRNTFAYLQPGGVFRFVLPDLEQLARDYLDSAEPDAAGKFMVEAHLGKEVRPRGLSGFLREWLGNSAHLWMWDFKSITRALERTGFANIRRARFGDSGDPLFDQVEDEGRWRNCLGVVCIRPT
jgi:hypothetical protein